MYKSTTMLTLALLLLVGSLPLLGACHTTAGAGEDISQAGTAMEKSADKHAP
jgi:predicted small secreted protein